MPRFTIKGVLRDNLLRSLRRFGTYLGREAQGEAWVADGRVWLINATRAILLGGYLDYLDSVKSGRRSLNAHTTTQLEVPE